MLPAYADVSTDGTRPSLGLPNQVSVNDNKLERRTTMSSEPILVTGSGGATGGATARQLLDRGLPVRAFVHRRGDFAEVDMDVERVHRGRRSA